MSTLTKSPLLVARHAFAVATAALRPYAHRFSPQRYTQPQLFACLVLKTFFKTDYRGLTTSLADLDSLRHELRLHRVPHFTTLQKASKRLLRLPTARKLFTATVRRFQGRRRRTPRVAFDSTGLDCGRRSFYDVRRRSSTSQQWQKVAYSHYAKFEAAFECATHLLVAVLASRGPRVDTDRFVPLLQATLQVARPKSVLADAGYDSEPNHVFARDSQGVRSFMPALIGRPSRQPPSGRYRRRMKQRLNKHYGKYGHRWQAESGFSMFKRRLGSTVQGRSYWSQCRDVLLMAITYNIMLQ
jgi:hypothetical protein